MRSKLFVVATLLMAFAIPAFAQAPQVTRANIRGKIVKLDGQTLTVKARDGASLAVMLAPNYVVRTLVRRKLGDIKPGDFVGTTSMRTKDGRLRAVEVHFFPANLQIPDSQTPWDLAPGAMMTNAHVAGIAKSAHGQVLSVTVNNATTAVIVDKLTTIVAPAPSPASAADLKPGRAVFIIATKAADGTLTAANVTVEKNGVKPPM